MNRRTMIATMLVSPYALATPMADVLLVGDSLAGQLGPRFAKEATARGKRFLYNFRAGSSTRQWARGNWLHKVLARHPSRLVLVSLGVNCTKAERKKLRGDMQEVRAQSVQIVEKVGSIIPVLWLLPPPLKFNTDYIREAVEGKSFYPGKLPLESDGIHPTDAGHKEWARLLAKELWG